MIETITFADCQLIILDQSRLPGEVVYEKYSAVEDLIDAIVTLKVRGAPLIGVAAAYGLALGVTRFSGSADELPSYFYKCKNLLAATRPTAVNLFWALERMEKVFGENLDKDMDDLAACLVEEANRMYAEDITVNRAIGRNGQALLTGEGSLMTICNAGALATCGYGTALGVVRSLHEEGRLKKVWACETRPVLQGARLTVWELMQDNIPVTLVTDNMAGYVMSLGHIDAVITGADRITANGDTANKIGTYSLAVLAAYHNIPFYIAAPLSTIDMKITSGRDIVIEERDAGEVRQLGGRCLSVPDVDVFNPAFDVTPHNLIKGIITEKCVVYPPYNKNLPNLFTDGGK